MNDAAQPENASNGRRSTGLSRKTVVFFVGLLAGLSLNPYCISMQGKVREAYFPLNGLKGYDTNHDGKHDYWRMYSENRWDQDLVDRNFDGEPDEWNYYEENVITRSEYDMNFDGAVDEWDTFEKGEPRSYRSDNDRDGRVDEWGTYEYDALRERNWSFRNDSVADKRAHYSSRRRTTELYDRDRDGEFDEEIRLDEFERVLTIGKPGPK